MKIAQVTPFFFPVEGGVERHVLNLSRELVKMGHEVDVYTSNGSWEGKALEKSCNVDGLRVRRFGTLLSLGQFGKVWPGFFPRVVSGGYDVVHSHVFRHPHTDISNLASKFSRSTSVLTSHSPFHPAGVRGGLARALVPVYDSVVAPVSLRSFDEVISLTRAEADILSTLSGGECNIRVIPHGVEEAHFSRVDTSGFLSKFRLPAEFVLYLGRVHPTKGIHWLIEAFSAVASSFPEASLVIAGPCQGEEEEAYEGALKRLVSSLGLSGRVAFTSRLSEADKLAALDACSFFVLPSIYEPYGIALLEAAAHGKPLLSTQTDGPMSIISEGVNGFLTQPGDAEGMAKLLARLLSDGGLRRSLGENARVLASSRRWDQVARETLRAYEGAPAGGDAQALPQVQVQTATRHPQRRTRTS